MPTYEYRCPEGHEFERFQKMTDSARIRCPRCGRIAVRKISGGAGLIFKGSGFYITDYGKDGKGRPKETETDAKEEVSPKPAEPAAEKPGKKEKKSGPKKASS